MKNEIQFWLFAFFGFAWLLGTAAFQFLAAKAEGALSRVVLKPNGLRWMFAKTARGRLFRNLCLAWFFSGIGILVTIALFAAFGGGFASRAP